MPDEVQLVVADSLLAVAELQLVIMVYLVETDHDFHLIVMIHNINIWLKLTEAS